jgi:hypothetical protein
MSLESKIFNWPPNKPEKKEVLENLEKVKNTYLIKNIQFMDQHEKLKAAKKEHEKDSENEGKKETYLKEKKEYEKLRDDISYLELMDEKPIPDEYFTFRTREDFLSELKNRDFTDDDLENLFPKLKPTEPNYRSYAPVQPEETKTENKEDIEAKLKFAKDTARPLEMAYWEEKLEESGDEQLTGDDTLSIEDMKKNLKFAKDTARLLDTAYWQQKVKEAEKRK